MYSGSKYPLLQQSISVEERVRRSFGSSVGTLLVNSLYESYSAVAEAHDTGRGFNNQTFGFNIYHVAVHHLAKLAEEPKNGIKLVSKNPIFRLGIGDFEMGTYRVGTKAEDDIWSSFPRTDGAAKSCEATAYLPGFARPDYLQSRHIILAHMGNPDDLLCAAYLCIPADLDSEDRITEWGFVYPLYGEQTFLVPTLETILAPVETRREVVVKKKDRQEQGRQ